MVLSIIYKKKIHVSKKSDLPPILRIRGAEQIFRIDGKKWSFSSGISSVNVANPQETADLVTVPEEIPNGKLHFLCSGYTYHDVTTFEVDGMI